ncbi:MAG: hypothetical protein PUA58_07800, partial [Ruminococcus sp.]|nr:hypothetical protein [Ruminococcus sp.]
PVATADMRRHSDTLRGAKRRRKRGLRGENGLSEAITRCLPVLICLPVIFKKIRLFPDMRREKTP